MTYHAKVFSICTFFLWWYHTDGPYLKPILKTILWSYGCGTQYRLFWSPLYTYHPVDPMQIRSGTFFNGFLISLSCCIQYTYNFDHLLSWWNIKNHKLYQKLKADFHCGLFKNEFSKNYSGFCVTDLKWVSREQSEDFFKRRTSVLHVN